jgi:peptidoglycan/xylan/chitin deacetylase (PgdA/CDA1 family)
MTPEEIADAERRGLDIQLHTHRHPMLDRDIDRLEDEIADNRAVLAAALPDKRFHHFCYPSGGFHDDAPARLRALGIWSATLCDQGANPPGTDPMRLRRFLDGRTVSQAMFEAYLSGALDLYETTRRRLAGRGT